MCLSVKMNRVDHSDVDGGTQFCLQESYENVSTCAKGLLTHLATVHRTAFLVLSHCEETVLKLTKFPLLLPWLAGGGLRWEVSGKVDICCVKQR